MCFFKKRKLAKMKEAEAKQKAAVQANPFARAPMSEPIMVATPKPVETPTPKPFVQPRPIEQPRPVEQPKPTEQPKPVVQPRPIEQPKPVEQPKPIVQPTFFEQPKPVEPVKLVEQPKPVVEPVIKAVEPTPKPVEEKPVDAPKAASNRYAGKYEVYPEAGLFKFRLKASNGEILVVSQGYASRTGAASGIETFKKNVEFGVFEYYTDKSNFTQFLLFTANKARLIANGEFYESVQRATSACESTKKFYTTDKLVNLDEIDPADVREELIDLQPVEAVANGKIEFVQVDGNWAFQLKASNGELLFLSSGFSSKPSAVQGLEVVIKAIEAGSFRVGKDKQGRYQFRLYSGNKMTLMTGETYPNKENCFSALDSVRRFYKLAKVVE